MNARSPRPTAVPAEALQHPRSIRAFRGMKLLIGGYHVPRPLGVYADRAAELLATGRLAVDQLITHRFRVERAPEAFALLDQHLDKAVGVLLEWTAAG